MILKHIETLLKIKILDLPIFNTGLTNPNSRTQCLLPY